MKLFHYLIFFAFAFLFFSCIKDSSNPVIATGFEDTFSCKVNGQLWTPAGDPNPFFGPPLIWVIYRDSFHDITMSVTRKLYDKSNNTNIDDFIILHNIQLYNNGYTEIKYDQVYNKAGCGAYITDTTKQNYIKTISIDTGLRRIKGIFQLECNGSYCRDNVKITDVQFEVKYRTL